MTIDLAFIVEALREISKVIPLTLFMTITPVLLGIVIGIIVAFVRIKQIKFIAPILNFYVSFFRGTPIIMHIMLVYFGLPMLVDMMASTLQLKIQSSTIPILFFVILALTLSAGAYASEIIRSGILSVPKGQLEAAYAIGLTFTQAMRRYILPQAFGQSIPNLTNVFIGFLHATSLAFFLSIKELTGAANIVASVNLKFLESFIAVGIIYWGISIVAEWISHRIEKRVTAYRKGGFSS
ncbi:MULTISPECIES: amino acid ABC transporter permease [Lysinibacillus]|jgi:L-cystine transport system permease protein|uniref:Amino acid ABC transporter permease n=1 Tax=Lysinibacillus fusiformis TaxID=28031 RepID=A0A2I0V214_9BACI|nr:MULTISPECIES: amino acid ABC transporter permease [Lysinibacillus]KUF32702.1 cysteine ABC transporter permease [Lysinibacillus sp. F5]MEE3805573.1 amino acid ABC transporter permease [Lysinibacillus fusiformis]PKU52272.1 amino acid ABC transporter permease [Lysinibacillus fusiformis]WCH46709.1 amino acid ABC transporter permease [Lysinibacillus sp. OF-1]SCY99918.1 amino acid ABC transporter membrane protein 2, PAAT family (TC 3.A.1.3.-) [Lysinibacillus sp. SG9]